MSGTSSGSGSGSNQRHENDAASDRESTSNMCMMNGTSNNGESLPRELANSRQRPGTAHALGNLRADCALPSTPRAAAIVVPAVAAVLAEVAVGG